MNVSGEVFIWIFSLSQEHRFKGQHNQVSKAHHSTGKEKEMKWTQPDE